MADRKQARPKQKHIFKEEKGNVSVLLSPDWMDAARPKDECDTKLALEDRTFEGKINEDFSGFSDLIFFTQ